MANSEEHSVKRARYLSEHVVLPSKPSLLMLNPDCLLQLFAYLHIDDLIAIAEVNSTLKSWAKYYFRLKYRHFNCLSLMKDCPVSADQMKKVLSNFGDQIVSLNMPSNIFIKSRTICMDLLLWAKRYCSVNVTALTLEEIELKDHLRASLISLFKYVETLELINSDFTPFEWQFAENLKCLKIESTKVNWEQLSNTYFANLEDVHLMDTFISNQSLRRFISLNSTLKRLSIVNCGATAHIFDAVGQLKKLEMFEFLANGPNLHRRIFRENMGYLNSLNRLKLLRLNCEKQSVHCLLAGFVANGIAIEHLELVDGQIDDATTETISKMATIRVLKLNSMIDLVESHILQMATAIKQLKELWVRTPAKISQVCIRKIVQRSVELSLIKIDSPGFLLNAKTYNEMVSAVKKFPKQTSLGITVYSDGGQLLVSDNILRAPENEKWVIVRELNRKSNRIFSTGDESDTSDSSGYDSG